MRFLNRDNNSVNTFPSSIGRSIGEENWATGHYDTKQRSDAYSSLSDSDSGYNRVPTITVKTTEPKIVGQSIKRAGRKSRNKKLRKSRKSRKSRKNKKLKTKKLLNK
jgi:hypothetical protein